MKKSKVLYVDDEKINLKLFEAVLERKYHIFTAENGMSGLQVLNENKDIQVVISDMKMPSMSGIEFITHATKIAPDIDFYILTGFEITDQIQDSIDAGLIRKYFRKPFNLNEISAEIDRVLNKNNL